MYHRLFFEPIFTKSVSNKLLKRLTDQRQAKNSSKPGICKICGDKARIINYGALSCQPCKTFFRRNGYHPERVPPCENDGVCDITKETRRNCPSCRLAKCLKEGMSSDLIRKEEIRSKKHSSTSKYKTNIHTVSKSRRPSIHRWMVDYSYYRQYLLLHDEKKTILHVVCALEIYSAIRKVRGIIEDELAYIFGLQFDQSDAIQCINHIYTSLRSFINCTPDFQALVIDEQSSLLQRNFTGVANLYSAFVFCHTGITNRPDLINSFASIYGSEMMLKLLRISKQLAVDLTTVKLFLLILALSSNCSTVDYQPKVQYDSLLTGTYHLFGSQNAYVVILWKYMVCQYGYYKAACDFSRLIQLSLDLIKSSAMSYLKNPLYHQLMNEFHENTEQFLVSNLGEQIRLWGII